jgi:hypothetical protein
MFGQRWRRARSTPATPVVPQASPSPEELLFPGSHLPVFDGTVLNLFVTAREPRLRDLFTQHGSDKGWSSDVPPPWPWPPHNYAEVYELVLGPLRRSARLIVECGIGTNSPDVPSNMSVTGRPGASLRAWRDYFPEARIIGFDIDPGCMFREGRISTAIVDQTDRESIAAFLQQSSIGNIDVVIDDGLHVFNAGRVLFEMLFPRLSTSGVYIIEDVGDDDLVRYREFFADRPDLTASFVRLHRPGIPIGDNSLVIVQPDR